MARGPDRCNLRQGGQINEGAASAALRCLQMFKHEAPHILDRAAVAEAGEHDGADRQPSRKVEMKTDIASGSTARKMPSSTPARIARPRTTDSLS
jgi:hypothetical protein